MTSPSSTVLPASPCDHRLWAAETPGRSALLRQQQQRIGHGPVHQLHQPSGLRPGAQGEAQHGDLQIFPHVVAVLRHADGRGLERRQPKQFLDALVDVPLVGGRRRAVLEQQLLRHTLVHAAARWQVEGSDECVCVHPTASGSTTR